MYGNSKYSLADRKGAVVIVVSYNSVTMIGTYNIGVPNFKPNPNRSARQHKKLLKKFGVVWQFNVSMSDQELQTFKNQVYFMGNPQ